ncbi:hypothetical protein KCP70_17405 [Salmonella enterica subsp. enterica]|nr:hypothetical protein KCP70_17405 [Salmonella enterica subsp. enterica]
MRNLIGARHPVTRRLARLRPVGLWHGASVTDDRGRRIFRYQSYLFGLVLEHYIATMFPLIPSLDDAALDATSGVIMTQPVRNGTGAAYDRRSRRGAENPTALRIPEPDAARTGAPAFVILRQAVSGGATDGKIPSGTERRRPLRHGEIARGQLADGRLHLKTPVRALGLWGQTARCPLHYTELALNRSEGRHDPTLNRQIFFTTAG